MSFDKHHRAANKHPLRSIAMPGLFNSVSLDAAAEQLGYGKYTEVVSDFVAESTHDAGLRREFRSAINCVMSIGAWVDEGRIEFVVSRDLAVLFRETDYDIEIGELKLPFPTFFIRWLLPDIDVLGSDQCTHGRVLGALVADRTDRFGHHALSISAIMSVDGAPSASTIILPTDDPAVRLSTDAKAGSTATPSMLSADNLVVNTLLYLQSPGSDTRKVAARQPTKKQRRSGRDPGYRGYIYVGHKYDGCLAKADAATAHLEHRVRVRGHWRQQAHGPRHSLRMRMWIEPHWRGPDTAEAVQRVYKVT